MEGKNFELFWRVRSPLVDPALHVSPSACQHCVMVTLEIDFPSGSIPEGFLLAGECTGSESGNGKKNVWVL